MGVTQQEIEKISNLTHVQAYKRIKTYYVNFMKMWNSLTVSEQKNYVFGNGRQGSPDYVNASLEYLLSLPVKPNLEDSLLLAKHVTCGKLEYVYHDEDINEIKMGAYAKYINNNFGQI